MSNKKRKLCVVTGTRADYGLLYPIMKEIQNDNELELQIIATGMHLSYEFGLTYKTIEQDGFEINEKVVMLLSNDSHVGITKSIGLGIIGFADTLDRLQPDLLILLGDRYEILAAAQAALVANIPIAHIAGGDSTEGAIDDAIRHSVTKMSHLHFVTNESGKERVIQMGENPNHTFNVGSPGIDQIKHLKLLSKSELEDSLGFKLKKRNLLVTYHPVTLGTTQVSKEFEEILNSLDKLDEDVGIIFTKPNSDTDGRILIGMIDDFVRRNNNAIAHTSLGQLRYLSTIKHVDIVLGNSSSGLYEVPSFKKPTVNIGNRQQGRVQASSIINCKPSENEISEAISKAFKMDCTSTINPYGDGKSTSRIIKVLKEVKDYSILLQKRFYKVETK